MNEMIGWTLLAVAFAGVWTYAFYREDYRNPEPLWMVLLAMGGGAAALFLAGYLEDRLLPDATLSAGSLAARAKVAFLVAGPVEEGAKFLAVLLLVWPWTQFDEPVDGIIYGAAAGAGFALAENLGFLQSQPASILARGPAATGVHVLFAGIWGGALGCAGYLHGRWRRGGVVFLGLLLAALAHGLFDMITFSSGRELTLNQGRAAQVALVIGCLLFVRWRLRVALTLFPFRYRKMGDSP
jgi:RsiW-degrading membrane proteinase PrsW (M82 family)